MNKRIIPLMAALAIFPAECAQRDATQAAPSSGGCELWRCGANGPSLHGRAGEVHCDFWTCGTNGPSLHGRAPG